MAKEMSLKQILDNNIKDHKAEMKIKSSLTHVKVVNDLIFSNKWQSSNIDCNFKIKKNLEPKRFKESKIKQKNQFLDRMFLFTITSENKIDKNQEKPKLKLPNLLKSMNSECQITDMNLDFVSFNDNTIPNGNVNDLPIYFAKSVEKYDFPSPRYPKREDKMLSKLKEPESEVKGELIPHYLLPRYESRYRELIRFRNEIIQEKDGVEREILTGGKLVNHLENRLKMKLQALQILGRTPNFQRLQIFSDIFDDLISESDMFRSLLSKIKYAYDAEVDRVLKMPVSEKEFFQSHMEKLKNSIYDKEKLRNVQLEVAELEEAIKETSQMQKMSDVLLKEEEKKLKELLDIKSKYDEEQKKMIKPKSQAAVLTNGEKLELFKNQCWNFMDEISQLYEETRTNMTPKATIDHLTNGLKDITIDVEKLNHHKDQLELDIDQMSSELYQILEGIDISEDDSKLIHTLLTDPSSIQFCNYEESKKWDWYIS